MAAKVLRLQRNAIRLWLTLAGLLFLDVSVPWFAAGTVLFSGSLYLLVVTGARWLGAITPLGGLAFIAGWLLLAWAAWTARA